MKKLIIFSVYLWGSLALAGGDYSEAKIIDLKFNDRAQAVFQIEWANENGFLSKSDFKKFVIDFHNWPPSSKRWFHQLLPWTTDDSKAYPLVDVKHCQNMMLNAFKKGIPMQLGQMGTVPFRASAYTTNAAVVPYAKVIRQEGVDVCLLYAAPI